MRKKKQKFSVDKLRYANQSAVVESLREMKKIFLQGDWLSKRNRYRVDTINRLKVDVEKKKINSKYISTYIGISSIQHCYDGWKYLGRAVSSAVNIDLNNARHLAYYAELRAAISILSSQGIGVFNDRHIIIGKNQVYDRKSPGTHPMTWEALGYFANQRKSSSSLLSIIQPNQNSLGEWLNNFGINTYQEKLGKEWLYAWGLDIKRFSLDRESRNNLSYRPSQINDKYQIDLQYLIEIVNSIWESSEFPTFKKIDSHLLKQSLIRSFELITATKVKNNSKEYEKRIRSLITNLAPSGYSADFWFEFLTNVNENSMLVKEAFGTAELHEPNHYIQMISRAFILLRIASGYVRQNMLSAGISGEEFKFWWRPLIKYLGYTNSDVEIDELNDVLFSDVMQLKDELKFLKGNPKYSESFGWCNNFYEHKCKISQMERIGVAALAI